MVTARKPIELVVSLLFVVVLSLAASAAEPESVWTIKTSSGNFSIDRPAASPATAQTELRSGDKLSTGADGRVQLRRGQDTLSLSPGAAIEIPRQLAEQAPPAIVQRAGSVEYDLDAHEAMRFAAETPYFAAVGARASFRMAVDKDYARVDVFRGEVEVADFKTGETAVIAAQQTAEVAIHGAPGLSLSGVDKLAAIRQGRPRALAAAPAAAAKALSQAPALAQPLQNAATPRSAPPLAPAVIEPRQGAQQSTTNVAAAPLVKTPATVIRVPAAARPPRAAQIYDAQPTATLGQADVRETTAALARALAASGQSSPAQDPQPAAPVARTARDATAPATIPTATMGLALQQPLRLPSSMPQVAVAAQLSDLGRAQFARDSVAARSSNDAQDIGATSHAEPHRTKAAIENFFAKSPQTVITEYAKPPEAAAQSNTVNVLSSDHGKFLSSWGLPLLIGALIAFAVSMVRKAQPRDDRRLDYDY